MKLRKLVVAAVAAFVFAGATAALAGPPLTPCQECRIAYNVCLYEGHGQRDAECLVEYNSCRAENGCPLE
ncbi:hypothetical protein ACFQ4Q_18210 [Lysobacter gummosus]